MNADTNETVADCHGLNLSHRLWVSQLAGAANPLRLEIIRLARDNLPPGIHT